MTLQTLPLALIFTAAFAVGPAAAHTLMVDPGAEAPDPVTAAVARLQPTAGNQVRGTVWLQESEAGLASHAKIVGLPAGSTHAYHVHVYGDCTSDDGKSAGTHFHFEGSSLNPPADIEEITGNLGELVADDQGVATHRALIPEATLQGEYTLLGRSVVIHAKPNDATQPPIGAAGDRLACGVIGVSAGE